eukprot:tig00000057_g148.t1
MSGYIKDYVQQVRGLIDWVKEEIPRSISDGGVTATTLRDVARKGLKSTVDVRTYDPPVAEISYSDNLGGVLDELKKLWWVFGSRKSPMGELPDDIQESIFRAYLGPEDGGNPLNDFRRSIQKLVYYNQTPREPEEFDEPLYAPPPYLIPEGWNGIEAGDPYIASVTYGPPDPTGAQLLEVRAAREREAATARGRALGGALREWLTDDRNRLPGETRPEILPEDRFYPDVENGRLKWRRIA